MPELDQYVRPNQGVDTQVFVEPSPEAKRLVRRLGWLVAPENGRGSLLSRMFGVIVVAPFTQHTFVSYDLEVFLFEIFHQKIWSRLGHFIFMIAVNFSMMVGLSQVWFGAHPVEHGVHLFGPNLGTAYAGLLLVWYFFMARQRGMWAWWLLMIPMVALLSMGANAWYTTHFILDPAARGFLAPLPLVFNPWLWAAGSAFMIALSHSPEERLPPRVTEEKTWRSLPSYFLGDPDAPTTFGVRVVRLVRMGLQVIWGTLDEWWASPRLMPYNVLMLLFRLGYRPDEWAKLRDHVERAQASGNPALDFVGIGGGAFLQEPEAEEGRS